MLKAIILFHRYASRAIEQGVPVDKISAFPVKEDIVSMRYIPHSEEGAFDLLEQAIKDAFIASDIGNKGL